MARKAKEEKPLLERTYTIPLKRNMLKVPRYKRAKKAVSIIRNFLVKHMKVSERDIKKIKLDMWLNRALWIRGIKKPPYKITIKATKDAEGIVKAEFIGLPAKYKVEEAELLRRKTKIETKAAAKTKAEEEKKKEEAKKKEEESKKTGEEKKKEGKETEKKGEEKSKTEEEKAEEEKKKEKEKILHKEVATKSKSEEIREKHTHPDGKKEKQVMFRKALKK